MPPKTAASNATKRKGPQFNPPRPVKASAKPSAASKRTTAGSAKASASRPQQVTTIILSDEDGGDLQDEEADDDDLMEEAPSPSRTRRQAEATFATPDPIPAPLLARLLYENFEDPNTQIQKGAMTLVAKYMEIFVREALARAKAERAASVKAGGISDGFLQVEDLEKLAPQLVLDF